MRLFIFFCCAVASTAGFKFLRRPCNGYAPCDTGYNALPIPYANTHYSAQTDINNRRLIQIVNNNNIQNHQQTASIQHNGGPSVYGHVESAYNSYPAVGYNGQNYGNSGAVAASSAVASSSASSWNHHNGHIPTGGLAHSNSASWSSSSSGRI